MHRVLDENFKRKSRACVNLKFTVIWLAKTLHVTFTLNLYSRKIFVLAQDLLEPLYHSRLERKSRARSICIVLAQDHINIIIIILLVAIYYHKKYSTIITGK